MKFKDLVISLLNSQSDFTKAASGYFKEKPRNIFGATEQIIETTIYALYIQCSQNGKSKEICRIAKDCASLKFVAPFTENQMNIVTKGRSVNSELFGVSLLNVIDEIASKNSLKSRIINTLTAIISPAILTCLYNVATNNLYNNYEVCTYLQSQNQNRKNVATNAETGLVEQIIINHIYNKTSGGKNTLKQSEFPNPDNGIF